MINEAKILISEIHQSLEVEYPFLKQWKITFDHAKKRAGICKITTNTISISLHHIQNNALNVIEDTILHEFAHAIAYELYKESGHGYYWKKVALKIGASPKARGVFKLPDAPWLIVHACPKTEEIKTVSERFRRNKKIKNYFLIGRPETKGELYFVRQAEYNEFKQGLLDKNRLMLIQ